MGQIFIFLTIAKFGALTCSLITVARKVTTLATSVVLYNHDLTSVQMIGLLIAVGATAMNLGPSKKEKSETHKTGNGK